MKAVYRRKRKVKKTLAVGLCLAMMLGMGTSSLSFAEDEGDELFIEDSGEEVSKSEGISMEELQESFQTEPQSGAVELEDDAIQLEPADPERLQMYLTDLGTVESPTGSDGELDAGDYIMSVMEELGYEISQQSFHEGFLNEDGVDAPGINILAERGANAEERTDRIVIVAAHYDTMRHPRADVPADKDRTGVAALLETARILSYEELSADVCFLFLSGEEDGLYGSEKMVSFLESRFGDRIAAVVNVERVGYDGEAPYLLCTADGSASDIGDLFRKYALTPAAGEAAALMQEADGAQGVQEIVEEETEIDLSEIEDEEASEEDGLNDWDYMADTKTSQIRYADAGIPALTVLQDVYGEYPQNAEETQSQDGETEFAQEPSVTASQGAEAQEAAGEEAETASESGSEGQEVSAADVQIEKLQEVTELLSSCIAEMVIDYN